MAEAKSTNASPASRSVVLTVRGMTLAPVPQGAQARLASADIHELHST